MNDKQYQDDEIDLKEYIKVILKRKKTILAVLLICVITATIASFLTPKLYEASAIIEIEDLKAESSAKNLPLKEKSIMKLQTSSLLQNTIQNLGLNIGTSELKKMMQIEDIKKTNFIKIKIRHLNPDLAVKICNGLIDAFILDNKNIYDQKMFLLNHQIEFMEERNNAIETEIEKINQTSFTAQPGNPNFPLIQNVLSDYESLRIQINERIYTLKQELLNFTQPQIFEYAAKAHKIRPNITLNILASIILGLFAGTLLVFFRESLQKK